MTHDPNVNRSDFYHINTRDPHEIEYWTREFGVSPEELVSIVCAVGHAEDKVRERLAKKPAAGGPEAITS